MLDVAMTPAVWGFIAAGPQYPASITWPANVDRINHIAGSPSSAGAEEVQQFGLRRTAELLERATDRIHSYSWFDLPKRGRRPRVTAKPSYYRHFYMRLVRGGRTRRVSSA